MFDKRKRKLMHDLIKIEKSNINGSEINSVNARETYDYLGLAKGQFSRWIKSAIEKYDFVQNEDYITIDTDVEGVKDYIVSLDMAKHLGMLEKNDKGHEIRKYFIEQEKIARNVTQNLQIEIGKAMQYLEQFTNSLSDAGRLLSVGGKQIKPKLINELDTLIGQAQHSLNFGNGE